MGKTSGHHVQRFSSTRQAITGRGSHRFPRAVIHGRTKTAGHQHHIGSADGDPDGMCDILLLVAHNRFESEDDPNAGQFIGYKDRIRIDPSSNQEFGPDGNRFSKERCFGLHGESCIEDERCSRAANGLLDGGEIQVKTDFAAA